VKVAIAAYLASWVVSLASVVWFVSSAFGILGDDAKVSTWPFIGAVIAMIASKYLMVKLNKREAANG
jgi:hypothetical protein